MFSFVIKTFSYALTLCLTVISAVQNEYYKKNINDEVFPEVYEGDFYKNIPYEKYLNYDDNQQGVVYDVRDFGAVPNDDSILNHVAINNTINFCSQNGGGTVFVDGGSYRVGSIAMKSNVSLKIAKDSSLVASRTGTDMNLGCVISGIGCENIKITGPGKICGEGNYYSRKPFEKPLLTAPVFSDLAVLGSEYSNRVRDGHSSRYGGIAVFSGCTGVTIENVVFENSAHWTLKLENCIEVTVNKFIVNNNRHIENTDGIDVLYSRNVEIGNTFISTGDDGIVLKNWSADKTVENVHVYNCEVMSCTNSFKIGTETRGDIKNILVENCSFFMREIYPGTGTGIAVESTDGTKLTDIKVRNITMDRVACPLFIRLGNRNRYPDASSDFSGTINGVTIENITATNVERSAIITGVKNKDKGTNYVKNVTLRNFSLTYTAASKESPLYMTYLPEYEDAYPDSGRFFNLSAYGIWARHTDGLKTENFIVQPPAGSRKREYVFFDVLNFSAE